MITRNQAGFNVIPLDTPEVEWVDPLNGNWETLRRMNPVGGLAITARDVDPATLAPTSLYYNVAAGIIRYLAGIAAVGPYVDRVASASTSIYIWLDMSGNIYQGAAFPAAYPYVPLGRITADNAKITSIDDYRNPTGIVPGVIPLARVNVTNGSYVQAYGVNYIRVVATAGPATVTLGDPAWNVGQGIIVRKADASGNAVTVAAPAGHTIDGNASVVLAAQGTRILTSDGLNFETVL
jgi:hypothetical protein